MGDCSCARTNTAVGNDGLADDDDTDGEQTNETGKEKTMGELLKKLENVKKREIRKSTLKDLLDSNGVIAVRGLKSKQLKELKQEQTKLTEVHCAVKYVKTKMDKRRKLLQKNTKDSRDSTYPWRTYLSLINATRL